MSKSYLVALDFDHTIVDGNTDYVVRNLLPKNLITDDIRKLYLTDCWTNYMQAIFYLLHEKEFTPKQIKDAVVKIPVVPNVDKLLRFLHQSDLEVIIISDSNSLFIEEWLSYNSLSSAVKKIFTNPAFFDENQCLKIQMYHVQDWCNLSTKNMCKGHILESYIEERKAEGVIFSRIAYVGDGKNDLCPCLKLTENDIAFPREGFKLENCIKEMQEKQDENLKARVHIWKTGDDVIKIISDSIN